MTEGHKGSFWTTLPDLLTGAAALITAITGATLATRGDAPPSGPTSSADTATSPSAKAEAVRATEATEETPGTAAKTRGEADPLAEALKADAAESNKVLPTRINDLVTYKRVSAEGHVFTMYYDVARRVSEDEQTRSTVLASACASAELRENLAKGVTLRWHYDFLDNSAPLEVQVTAASCGLSS